MSPVQVSGISTAAAVSVGVIHTCAVLQDGTARCWGYNSNGQIGDGTTTEQVRPGGRERHHDRDRCASRPGTTTAASCFRAAS